MYAIRSYYERDTLSDQGGSRAEHPSHNLPQALPFRNRVHLVEAFPACRGFGEDLLLEKNLGTVRLIPPGAGGHEEKHQDDC